MVIFTFGLMITFIVALGLINAKDLRTRQRAKDFQLDKPEAFQVTFTSTKNKQTSSNTRQNAA